MWRDVALALGGVVLLVAGAQALVTGVTDIALALQVSTAVIGLTVVAIGTSMPELATSVVAAWRGERDIAIGNIVGSNIFNLGARSSAGSTSASVFRAPGALFEPQVVAAARAEGLTSWAWSVDPADWRATDPRRS